MKTYAFFALLTVSLAHAAAPTGRYKTIVDQMNALQQKFPGFAEIYNAGDNDDGVPIYAMRVSTTPKYDDPAKVGQLIVSTHHGNELKAPEFTMYFLERLLERFQSTELFRGNLASTEWHILPVLNISGYNANSRQEKGMDPNRDYPGPCITQTGGRLKSIRVAMDLFRRRPFASSLTVHGYVGALTYPWGVNVANPHSLDHNAFASIVAKAALQNGYRHGTSTEIVYPCDGAFEDYAYWKYGVWSLLLELRSGTISDIQATSGAIASYFNDIDSSPSVKNQLTSQCRAAGRLDLGTE